MEYYDRLLGCASAMAQAGVMVSEGLISPEEYAAIDAAMAEKYGVSSSVLFCESGLLYGGVRANMSREEVAKCPEK